ncbi:MAG: BON domain-containing protein [Terriglobales bacterium]
MREVLEALDWVRHEMMHRGSPDFIRQRQLEQRVHQLASGLARSNSGKPVSSPANLRHPGKTTFPGKHGNFEPHRKLREVKGMKRVCLLLLVLGVFTATVVAQTTALPSERQRLGGNDPSARISREVMHELLMLPYYSVWDNLAYQVNGNTVTLLGQVVNGATKSDAESAVKHIEGVQKVINNIEVLPPSPMDDRIRRQEYRAIFGFDGLSRYSWGAVPSIHIIVKNGHVTLVGVVDNDADKHMAEIQARQVPGVFSVDNQLQVASNRPK